MTSIEQITYLRRCDECRISYEHTKGAPTGWCPACAASMLVPQGMPFHPGFHLPYVKPCDGSDGVSD